MTDLRSVNQTVTITEFSNGKGYFAAPTFSENNVEDYLPDPRIMPHRGTLKITEDLKDRRRRAALLKLLNTSEQLQHGSRISYISVY